MPTPPGQILAYAVPDERASVSKPRRVLRFGKTWLLSPATAFVGLAIGVGVSQVIVVGVVNAFAALIVTTALVVVFGACARSARTTRARRVLVYVEQAVRLNVPVPEFLLAAARSEDHFVASRLRGVSTSIANGARLGDALRNEVPELPLRTTSLLRSAGDNGSLPATLTRVIDETRSDAEGSARRQLPWVYLAMMIVALPTVVVMLCVFVVPKWAQIFHDFGVPMPPWYAAIRRVDVGWSIVLGASVVLSIAILVSLASRSARWVLFGRHDLASLRTLPSRVTSRVPIVGALSRDRDYGDACQTIANGLAFHRPIDVVLAEAGTLKLDAVLLERLRLWRSFVLSGLPLGHAARQARMPSLIADLVGPRPSAEAFAFLSRHYHRRADRRGEWLAAFAMPTMTLTFAVLVGGIAYAMFDSIARLIDATMPYRVGI